jgi:hypothetical protein
VNNKNNWKNLLPAGKIQFSPVYLHPFLIVIYFFLHESNANFGLIPLGIPLSYGFYYLLGAVFIILFSLYFLQAPGRAFVFSSIVLVLLLFFGSMHDFVKNLAIPGFFKKYTFWLLFLPCLVIAAFVLFKRYAGKLVQFNKYLFITSLILCVWEIVFLLVNVISGKADVDILAEKNAIKKTNQVSVKQASPSIYFIVFDGFTSSTCLQEEFNYNNAGLDSFLVTKGFYIVTKSKSNYPATPYSLASTLNFSYLKKEIDNTELTAPDMLKGAASISKNRLISYLEQRGYKIFNYSIFNLAGHPALGKEYFFGLKQRIFTQQTLLGRLKRDLLWNITMRDFATGGVHMPANFRSQRTRYLQDYLYNNLNGLESAASSAKPKFVYCHVMVPHEPYYFNKDGTLINESVLSARRDLKKSYLNQLIYSRQLVKSAVNAIFKRDTGNKIIIVEGDHGFRDFGSPDKTARIFDNLNAIYFYDKNYQLLHDSMTPVNTFRVVLNQYFHEQLPYLRDTSIFINDPSMMLGQH